MKWTWTGWGGSSVWYTFCHQVLPLSKSTGPWPKRLQTGRFWFELQLSSSSDRSFVLDWNFIVLNVELKFLQVQICTRTTCVSPVRRIIQKHTWMEDGSSPRTEPVSCWFWSRLKEGVLSPLYVVRRVFNICTDQQSDASLLQLHWLSLNPSRISTRAKFHRSPPLRLSHRGRESAQDPASKQQREWSEFLCLSSGSGSSEGPGPCGVCRRVLQRPC